MYFDTQDIKAYSECSPDVLSARILDKIVYVEFESNKSTWSEIKTVISALDTVLKNAGPGCNIELYTDCQSLCDLLGKRRDKLLKSNFITRAGKTLQHANLYQELFQIVDLFQIQAFKLKGHQAKSRDISMQEKIFALLDNYSRQKLRLVVNNLSN